MKIWIIEPEESGATAIPRDQITRMGERMGPEPPALIRDRLHVEKRLYPRIPCFLMVDFVTQECAYRAFIRNISADGAFIESEQPVHAGPRVSLVISFPEEPSTVKTAANIVRIGEQGIGVKFNPADELFPDRFPS